jgi:hypothetical protein
MGASIERDLGEETDLELSKLKRALLEDPVKVALKCKRRCSIKGRG